MPSRLDGAGRIALVCQSLMSPYGGRLSPFLQKYISIGILATTYETELFFQFHTTSTCIEVAASLHL